MGSWGRSERIWAKVRTGGTDTKMGRMREEGVCEFLQGAVKEEKVVTRGGVGEVKSSLGLFS